MTFCTFYEDCARAAECHRPLTPEVHAAAVKWWGRIARSSGDDAPIGQFCEKPGCWRAFEEESE